MRKRAFLLLLSLLMVLTFTWACAPNRRPGTDMRPEPQERTRLQQPVQPSGPRNISDMTTDRDTADNGRRADKIEDDVRKVDNVRSAVVLLNGGTAYIGVNLEDGVAGRATESVKDNVETAAKKSDRTLTRVYVTTDAGSVARLRDFAAEIKRGRPISGFMEELNEMFR
jgi:YhcN/YlaJ family sporulation lipoprotein